MCICVWVEGEVFSLRYGRNKLEIKLDVFKSAEPNEIYLGIFKELTEVFAEPLAALFQNSRRSYDIPEF